MIKTKSTLLPALCLGAATLFSPASSLTITDSDWLPVSGAPGGVECMAMDSIGNIYVGGQFRSTGGNTIGMKWDTLPEGVIRGTPIYDSLIIYNNIAKWDGVRWSTLDSGLTAGHPNLTARVNALAVHGTDLYAGGFFYLAGNVDVRHIAKWDGTKWSAVGAGFNDQVQALSYFGSDLYAGGGFTKIWGAADSSKGIAKWNGTSWSSLGKPIYNLLTRRPVVLSLVPNGPDLYVGGYFTIENSGYSLGIAKWNGSAFSPVGNAIHGYDVSVYAIAIDGQNIYAGGSFRGIGGVAASNIARWNGSAWSALGTGVQGGQATVQAVAVQGADVFVTGSWFETVGGTAVSNIAHWDGLAWKAMGQGLSGYGNDFVFNKPRNALYVGGAFGRAGGRTSPGLAAVQIALMGAPTRDAQWTGIHPDTASVKLTWIIGNGKARIIAISKAPTSPTTPKDSTTYVPSTEFGKGDTVGSPNWYCVFNGDTATAVTVTGLVSGTTYFFTDFEYNNGPGTERFIKYSDKVFFVTLPGGVNPIALDTVRVDSALFRWHGVLSATRYEFQIATDTSFTANLTRDTAVTDSGKMIKGLADGTYYWRVRASNNRWGAWSVRQKSIVRMPVSARRPQPVEITPFTFGIRSGTLFYQVPSACRVSLHVFDMQGRLAATLIDAYQAPGYHSVKGFEKNLTTSCYVVVFRAGAHVQKKKVFLTN